MSQDNKKWIIAGGVMFAFMIGVSWLAYKGLLPAGLKSIPYYDSAGHFLLFGMLGLFAERAFRGSQRKLFGVYVPIGATVVALYAIVDESFQVFSASRRFDLMDVGFGLSGIIFFYFLSRRFT